MLRHFAASCPRAWLTQWGEVLHALIADLLEGAEALGHGPALIGRALERYPEYFEHPDWPGPEDKKPSNSAM